MDNLQYVNKRGSVLPTSFEIDIWVDGKSNVGLTNNLAILMLR